MNPDQYKSREELDVEKKNQDKRELEIIQE